MKPNAPYDTPDMMPEDALRDALCAGLDSAAPPDGFEARLRASLPERRFIRRRTVWAAALLASLLLVSIAVASSLIWPELIAGILGRKDVSDKTQAMLSMMEIYGGHEVVAQDESAGVRMRTHFMVCDGSDISVFFSLENETAEPALFEELLEMASADMWRDGGGSAMLTLDIRQDEATGLHYGMASGTLLGVDSGPVQIEEGDALHFQLFNMGPMPPTTRALCAVTPETIAGLPLEENIADLHENATLVLHEATCENGTLDIRYTMTQQNDDLPEPRYRTYLTVRSPEEMEPTFVETEGWTLVEGEGWLTVDNVPETAFLTVVSCEAYSFRSIDPSFALELPARVAEAVPVRDIPLDILLDRNGVPLRLVRAEMRPTSLTVLAEIRMDALPEALHPPMGQWANGREGTRAIRQAAYTLRADLETAQGEVAGLIRTDTRMQYPTIQKDGMGAAPEEEDAAIEVFHKYTGLLPADREDMRLVFYGEEDEVLASVEIPEER